MKAENWMETTCRLRESDLNKKLVYIITDDLLNAYDKKDLYTFNWICNTVFYTEEMYQSFIDILNPFVDEMENIYEAFSWYNVQLGYPSLPKIKKPTMQDMVNLMKHLNNPDEFKEYYNKLMTA